MVKESDSFSVSIHVVYQERAIINPYNAVAIGFTEKTCLAF